MVWTPPDGIVKLPRFGGRFRGGGLSVCLHLLFVANGRAIPQGGVPPGGIVEAFDEAEAGHACLDLRGKAVPLEQFAFEGGKKALAQGVIVSVPDRAHREPDAGLLAALAERQRGILPGFKWSSQRLPEPIVITRQVPRRGISRPGSCAVWH